MRRAFGLIFPGVLTMAIALATRKGVAIVAPTGRVDAAIAKELERILLDLLATRRAVAVLDLAQAEGLSLAGLRPLLAGAKQAAANGGRLLLAGVPESAAGLLAGSGFAALFEIHKTVDAALASLGPGGGRT